MSWTTPQVLVPLIGGMLLLCVFVAVEQRVPEPMFDPSLFRIKAFTAGNIAGFIGSVGRGGLQFVLIVWLQGIWLPLHGYDYSQTPLWAGIYLLPMTVAFLISGPGSGWLSDRWGSRGLVTTGMLIFAVSFIGLVALPVDFPYWAFALMTTINGLGVGVFSAPNSSAIMGSVPAQHRGAASGMLSTFQNSGTALSIGAFFSLMIAGLGSTLPSALNNGLTAHGVPPGAAHKIANLPPVASLFSAILGVNPIGHLLSSQGVLDTLAPDQRAVLTSRTFLPPAHRTAVPPRPCHRLHRGVSSRGARRDCVGATRLRHAKPTPTLGAAMTSTVDPAPLDPARTALLVMDLQNSIVDRYRHTETLIEGAADAIAVARRAGATVCYVRVGFTDAEAAAVPEANRIFSGTFASLMHADQPSTAIVDRLAPQPGDVVVRKQRVGAFSTTDLQEQLRERGVDTLVLTGIATSGVVLSTVREAADRDYRVVVVEDLCFDGDPEVREVLTRKVFPRQAEVIDAATLATLFGGDCNATMWETSM